MAANLCKNNKKSTNENYFQIWQISQDDLTTTFLLFNLFPQEVETLKKDLHNTLIVC